LQSGIIIAIVKFVIVVAVVIGCLWVGALSLNAHDDGLLVVAALCAVAALASAVLGALWIFQSLRDLVRAMEK
jgi:hypothetical protein